MISIILLVNETRQNSNGRGKANPRAKRLYILEASCPCCFDVVIHTIILSSYSECAPRNPGKKMFFLLLLPSNLKVIFKKKRFGLGAKAPQTHPGLSVFSQGAKPPRACNGKHIQFISIECNLMLRVISEASAMTCSSHNSRDMSSIRSIQGFSHSLFPNIHLKSLTSASMFISICCKYILTNKLLTQRGLPFSSPWEA